MTPASLTLLPTFALGGPFIDSSLPARQEPAHTQSASMLPNTNLSPIVPDPLNSPSNGSTPTSIVQEPPTSTLDLINIDISSNASLDDPHIPTPPQRNHNMQTRSQNRISKPKVFTDGTVRYSLQRALTIEISTFELKPTSFTLAVKDEAWQKAISEEFNALLHNGTWSLVPYQPSMNVLGSKWIFRIKRNVDGSIERYKAWFIAKVFHQQPSIDFEETLSPVVKSITIRIVFSLVVLFSWPLQQFDVSNAFLHVKLSEIVYMAQSPGISHP